MRLTKLTSCSFGRRGPSVGPRFAWVNRGTLGTMSLSYVGYKNGYYWACGGYYADITAQLWRSADGTTWTQFKAFSDPLTLNQGFVVSGLEYDATGGLYFLSATGYNPNNGTGRGYTFVTNTAGSSASISYSGLDTFYGPSADTGTVILQSVHSYSAGQTVSSFSLSGWVKSSQGTFAPSCSDGRSSVTYPLKRINQIATGGGVVVVVGNYDFTAYSSNDGATFANVIGTFSGANIGGAVYGASKFIAISETGVVASSTNGSTWAIIATLPSGITGGIAYSAGVFIAQSSNRVNSYSSADGITWQTQALSQSVYSNNLDGSSSLAVVGTGQGTIYTSI